MVSDQLGEGRRPGWRPNSSRARAGAATDREEGDGVSDSRSVGFDGIARQAQQHVVEIGRVVIFVGAADGAGKVIE